MLLGTFLLFFSSVSTVKSRTMFLPENPTRFIITKAKGTVPPVYMLTKPDYQVVTVTSRTIFLPENTTPFITTTAKGTVPPLYMLTKPDYKVVTVTSRTIFLPERTTITTTAKGTVPPVYMLTKPDYKVVTVTSRTTNLPESTTTFITTTAKEPVPPVYLQAKPDYQVVTGPTVELYCYAKTIPPSIRWSWQHLEGETWREVIHGRNLNLTEPNQSGLYRCRAENGYSESTSNITRVYIIPMQPAEIVTWNLGMPGFVLSLLALIVILSVLCWLGWERLRGTQPPSNTAAKGFPAPIKAQKGGLPSTPGDGDVYMNYTSTNQDYSNLDPVNMTGDNMYSNLS